MCVPPRALCLEMPGIAGSMFHALARNLDQACCCERASTAEVHVRMPSCSTYHRYSRSCLACCQLTSRPSANQRKNRPGTPMAMAMTINKHKHRDDCVEVECRQGSRNGHQAASDTSHIMLHVQCLFFPIKSTWKSSNQIDTIHACSVEGRCYTMDLARSLSPTHSPCLVHQKRRNLMTGAVIHSILQHHIQI
jgi:hypothetical protein